MVGEKGATADITTTESDETLYGNNHEDDEVDISDVLKSVFPSVTVIVAAHHASTLQ